LKINKLYYSALSQSQVVLDTGWKFLDIMANKDQSGCPPAAVLVDQLKGKPVLGCIQALAGFIQDQQGCPA
jgi:hypothetical protein